MQYVVRSSRAIRGCRADMPTTPSSRETYLKLATPQELRNHSSISRNWRREKQLANKRAVAGVITEWSKVLFFRGMHKHWALLLHDAYLTIFQCCEGPQCVVHLI